MGIKRSDVETGLYYNVTRYYDPNIGRFISAADISYFDPESIGGLNLYAYCGNNPVMYVDPSGAFSLLISLAIIFGIGALSGVAGTFIGDVVVSVFTGEWNFSSWKTYAGAAIGYGFGAIGTVF